MVRDVHRALVDSGRRLRDHRRRRRVDATARSPCSRRLADEVPELRIVRHEANRGYGGALHLRLRRGDAASGSSTPTATPSTTPPSSSAASTPSGPTSTSCRASSSAAATRGTASVIGRTYHHVVRLLFRLRVRDTDCDFRLIRRDAARPGRADVDVGRDLRRDDAQVPGRRRPLRRGRRQPPRPPARPLAVLPAAGHRPLGPPARRAVVGARRPRRRPNGRTARRRTPQ